MSALAIFVSSTMAFPDNEVSWIRVFIILAAPPLLFIVGGYTLWLLHQLIAEFHRAWNSTSYSDEQVYEKRKALGITRVYKMVDTCSAEFEAKTPYFYSSFEG